MTSTSILARKRAAFRPASHLALALVLATGAFAASAVTAPAAYAQDKPKYSKKFPKVAQPVADALNKIQGDAELAAIVTQIAAADDAAKSALAAQLDSKTGIVSAIAKMNAAVETPDDRYTAGQYTVNWGIMSGDKSYQETGLNMSLESGKTPADKVGQYNWLLGVGAYQNGEYAKSQPFFRKAIENGWTASNPLNVLADSYFKAGDVAGGVQATLDIGAAYPALLNEDAVRGSLKSAYDANRFYDVVRLVTVLRDKYPSEDSANYYDNVPRQAAQEMTAEALNSDIARLLADNASPENWWFATNAIVSNANYTEAEALDAMRLLMRTKALRKSSEVRDYLVGLNATLYPTEAEALINSAIAGNLVSASDVAEWQAAARKNAGSDREYLNDRSNHTRAASDPKIAASLANTALSLGDAVTAEEMFASAVAKGGVDTDTMLIRLGIARLDQGNYTGAREAFGRVTDKHKNLASLWSAYAGTLESSATTTM